MATGQEDCLAYTSLYRKPSTVITQQINLFCLEGHCDIFRGAFSRGRQIISLVAAELVGYDLPLTSSYYASPILNISQTFDIKIRELISLFL